MIEKLFGAVFGWKGVLIGVGLAFLAGNISGGWAGWQLAEALGEAETLRAEKRADDLEKQGLSLRIEDLKATLEVRDEQIRAAGRINAELAAASQSAATAIDELKQAVADDEKKAVRRPECFYGDADYQRVQQLIEQARRAGQADRQQRSPAGGS